MKVAMSKLSWHNLKNILLSSADIDDNGLAQLSKAEWPRIEFASLCMICDNKIQIGYQILAVYLSITLFGKTFASYGFVIIVLTKVVIKQKQKAVNISVQFNGLTSKF